MIRHRRRNTNSRTSKPVGERDVEETKTVMKFCKSEKFLCPARPSKISQVLLKSYDQIYRSILIENLKTKMGGGSRNSKRTREGVQKGRIKDYF